MITLPRLTALTLFVSFLLILCSTSFVSADWDPADGHKMHFPQLPDETGWVVRDVPMNAPLGDDWECSESGWVKEIHFWGAWKDDVVGNIQQFYIRISGPGNSQTAYITNYQVRPIAGSQRLMMMPGDGPISDTGTTYFQYNIALPDSLWYWQEQSEIYWLYIAPILEDDINTTWGWYSSLDSYGSNAIYWDPIWMTYYDIIPPDPPEFHDLAFVINGDPDLNEACCMPSGACQTIGQTACLDLGGTPGGPGTACANVLTSCCLPDGSCQHMDTACCVLAGGELSPLGYSYCLGDNDGSGIDDGCEVCYAGGDVNGDGVILTVADMVNLIRYLNYDTTMAGAPYEADLNGDCRLDNLDVEVYQEYFAIGMPAFAPYGGYPVMTCCNPDTLRGATCSADSCMMMHPANVEGGWAYQGDYTVCDPENPCDTCTMQHPGDVDGDGFINVYDAVFLINWLYKGGQDPPILANADPDGNCCVDTNDVVYLTEYLFHGGPPPVECTCWEITFCDSCPDQSPGDINGDQSIDVADVTQLITYLTQGGDYPGPNADVNGDCWIEWCDVFYLNAFLYQGGPAPVDCTCEQPDVCDCNVADANGDGQINIGDGVFVISHIFKGGAGPMPYYVCNGDANYDCNFNIGDAVAIVNHVFNGGPAPVCCHDWIDDTTGCGLPLR